jgi:hypothetical protein
MQNACVHCATCELLASDGPLGLRSVPLRAGQPVHSFPGSDHETVGSIACSLLMAFGGRQCLRKSQTRSANYPPDNASACNIDDVREESGPTDTGSARGPLRTGDSSQGAVVMHRFPRQDFAVQAGELASSNIP